MKKNIFLCINIAIVLALFTGCTKAKDSLSYLADSNSNLEQPVLETKLEKYQRAINAIKEKHYPQAMGILADLDDFKDAKGLLEQLRYLINGSYIGNGNWAVGVLTQDGRVQIACDGAIKNKYSKAKEWRNIKAISFMGGESIEGLTAEGNIITSHYRIKDVLLHCPELTNVVNSVSAWNNIKYFQSNYPVTIVALTNDGFVYAAYPRYKGVTVKLQGWDNMASVADGQDYIVGLKKNGNVVCYIYRYGSNINTSAWKDIVAISASSALIGLKEDGTVVATGYNEYGEGDVSNWTDIIAISTYFNYTLGLKSDGTVVVAGHNTSGQMDVQGWKDIVAIAAGPYFSIGLKADGTMVLAGDCCKSGAKTPDVSGMKGLYVPQIKVN